MRKIILLAGLALIYWSATSCIYEAPYWTPDGKGLLVGALYNNEKGGEQYQFFSLNLETGKARQLTSFVSQKSGIYPTLSPDGVRIAYYYYDEEAMAKDKIELHVMNADGSGSREIFELTREEERFYYTSNPWSPNGQFLALQNFNPEKQIYQIIITNLEGQSKNLTEGVSSLLPSWSPEGEKIAYVALKPEDDAYDLVITHVKDLTQKAIVSSIALPKEHQKELTQFLVQSWSPDGKRIAYVNGDQIAVVDWNSGEKRDLTQGPGIKVYPRWSPEGTKLAFMKVEFKKQEPLYGESLAEIWVTDQDGKNAKALTDLKGEAYLPQWSPAGDKIAFLFAQGSHVSFLPGVTDLEGKVEFFPLNPFQKRGLALYYLNLNEEKAKKEAERLLKEMISEYPNTKWAGDAQDILDAMHPDEDTQRVKNST